MDSYALDYFYLKTARLLVPGRKHRFIFKKYYTVRFRDTDWHILCGHIQAIAVPLTSEPTVVTCLNGLKE